MLRPNIIQFRSTFRTTNLL